MWHWVIIQFDADVVALHISLSAARRSVQLPSTGLTTGMQMARRTYRLHQQFLQKTCSLWRFQPPGNRLVFAFVKQSEQTASVATVGIWPFSPWPRIDTCISPSSSIYGVSEADTKHARVQTRCSMDHCDTR
jgi:hypothetical protein